MTTPGPADCTLPTAEQPLRIAEFDELLAALQVEPARTSPTELVMDLRGGPAEEAAVRDLTVRETRCCSFFEFTLARTGDGRLRLTVRVPTSHSGVLDGLAELATTARAARRAPG